MTCSGWFDDRFINKDATRHIGMADTISALVWLIITSLHTLAAGGAASGWFPGATMVCHVAAAASLWWADLLLATTFLGATGRLSPHLLLLVVGAFTGLLWWVCRGQLGHRPSPDLLPSTAP